MALQLSGSLILTGSLGVKGAVTSTQTYSTIVFPDLEFNHVSGTRTYAAGTKIVVSGSIPFGGGLDSNYNLTLTPTASSPLPQYVAFRTENDRNIQVIGYRIYSNISGSDFPQYDNNVNGTKISFVSIGYVNKPTSNSTSVITPIEYYMYSGTSGSYNGADGNWSLIPTGSVKSTSPEIRDAGTLYLTSSNASLILSPTAYSPTYYTFRMIMGASFPTKTYKFRFEVDYQTI
jgi:hypothetical protein